MLVNPRTDALGELGLSLKPPKAATDLLKQLVSSVRIKATVPTPVGPIAIDSTNLPTMSTVRDTVSQVARGTRIDVTAGNSPEAPKEPIAAVTDFVQTKVPGGWITVLAGGGLLALLAMQMANPKQARRTARGVER